jgi:hypothetical protein
VNLGNVHRRVSVDQLEVERRNVSEGISREGHTEQHTQRNDANLGNVHRKVPVDQWEVEIYMCVCE